MLIGHAEKPDDMGTVLGVTPEGAQDPESLAVGGWQRARTLVHLFSGEARDPRYAAIETPDVIFATGVGHGSHSKRPWQTAQPLAEALVARTGNSEPFCHELSEGSGAEPRRRCDLALGRGPHILAPRGHPGEVAST